MLITELITTLEKYRVEHGDMPVRLGVKVSKRTWRKCEIFSVGFSGVVAGGEYLITGNIEKEEKE